MKGVKIEDKPLDAKDVKVLRELPAYWQMMMNSKASKALMNARIRAMVFLAQNLELRIAKLQQRIRQLKYENAVLKDEIESLRRNKLVWRSEPIPERGGPRAPIPVSREAPMTADDSTQFGRIYNDVVGVRLRRAR